MRGIAWLLAAAAILGAAPAGSEGALVHVVRFTDYEAGPVEDWLAAKGFAFERDARRRDRIDLDVGDDGLVLDTRRKAFGVLPNESVNVPVFSRVEVDWAVRTFPQGASYEKGVRNEALMLFVFLGDERQPSGSVFIPDSPYFVGLFLCDGDDRVKHPYVGQYFQKGGRYVCLDRPEGPATVTSRFDLLAAYRAYFDAEGDDDPAVSGIALGVDTQKAGGKGRASASIREIRFYR